MMTYGDGVSDVNLAELVEFHRGHGKEATVTAVQPPGRFGSIETNGAIVSNFAEKTQDKAGWINGGFFVLEPSVFARISNDQVAWENEPIQSLVESNQLAAYKHFGFWKPMDTLRDKNSLEEFWQTGTAPWKVW